MKLDASDIQELRPVIRAVVAEVLAKLLEERRQLDGQLAYRELQAAALLGVAPHVLRNARLRGEVEASRIGRYIVYSRDDLLAFLRRRST